MASLIPANDQVNASERWVFELSGPIDLVDVRQFDQRRPRRAFPRCDAQIEQERTTNMHTTRDIALLTVAVVLMLGGVAMIFTSAASGLAISVIAVGIALTAIVETEKRRHPHTNH
jgi:hypothetical protein